MKMNETDHRNPKVKSPSSQAAKWQDIGHIWKIIDRLRGEGGCPWDQKQTPETLQTYLLEESHETAAAIRSGDHGEVCGELGDLLFMILFLIYLYEEKACFELKDVCDHICEKMIRRHPHVFGDVSVNSAEEVKDNWEKIKAGEKKSGEKASGGIPASLPALVRAHRMASRYKGEPESLWDDIPAKALEFVSRSEELARHLCNGREPRPELLGDMLLDLTNMARVTGLRAEDCLHERLTRWEKSRSDKGRE